MAWIGAIASVAGSLIASSSTDKAAGQQGAGAGAAIAEQRRQYEQNRSDLAPYRVAGSAALRRLQSLLGMGPKPGTSQEEIANGIWDKYMKANNVTNWSDVPADQRNAAATELQEAILSSSSAGEGGGAYGDLLKKFGPSDLAGDTVYNSGLQFGLDEGTKAIERRAAASGGLDSGATLKAITRFGNDYGSTKAGDAYSRFTSDQDRTFGKLSGIAGMGSGATNVGVNAGSNSASNLSSLYAGLGNAQGAATIAGGNAFANGLTNAGNMYSQNQLLRQLTGGGARTLPSSSGGGGDELAV